MIKKVAAVAVATAGLMLAGAGVAAADQVVPGTAGNSPGIGSGNVVQVPIEAPINACGNSISVIGALNSTQGSNCVNN